MAASDVSAALSAQVARVNPRERKLLAVLALAVLAVGAVKAFDLSQAAQTRNLAAREALDTARMAQRTAAASGAGGQAARQRAEVKAWSWPGSTPQVGKVLAQDRIFGIASRAGMVGAQVKAADKIDSAGEVSLARIDVEAPFNWASLGGFLAGLAETKKGFLVDNLTIEDGAKPTLKIGLRLPIVADTPQTAEPAT